MTERPEEESDAAAMSRIYGLVEACAPRGVKIASNGTKFICHTPSRGQLAYLHTLYAPCADAMLEEIAQVFGFALPASYTAFMRLHNGAHLYSGTISISGLGGNFSRSLRDEDQAAISLAAECEVFRAVSKRDWQQGWRPIGAVVASNLHKFMIDPAGTVKFASASGRERHYPNFLALLHTILPPWSTYFSCDGLIGDDYGALEMTAERFASSAN